MIGYKLINNYINGVFVKMNRAEKHRMFLYYIMSVNHDFTRCLIRDEKLQLYGICIFPKE